MEIAAASIAGVIGLLMFLVGFQGIQTGFIKFRGGSARREESPVMFWIAIAGYFGAALIGMPILIRKLLWGA